MTNRAKLVVLKLEDSRTNWAEYPKAVTVFLFPMLIDDVVSILQ
jgi:hypothetical protein